MYVYLFHIITLSYSYLKYHIFRLVFEIAANTRIYTNYDILFTEYHTGVR